MNNDDQQFNKFATLAIIAVIVIASAFTLMMLAFTYQIIVHGVNSCPRY